MVARLQVLLRKGCSSSSPADCRWFGSKAREESRKERKSAEMELMDLISGLPRLAIRYIARIGVSRMYGGWPCRDGGKLNCFYTVI